MCRCHDGKLTLSRDTWGLWSRSLDLGRTGALLRLVLRGHSCAPALSDSDLGHRATMLEAAPASRRRTPSREALGSLGGRN